MRVLASLVGVVGVLLGGLAGVVVALLGGGEAEVASAETSNPASFAWLATASSTAGWKPLR